MTETPVVLREKAVLDAEEAVAYYLSEAGEKVAAAFIDALERAYRQIARYPESGSQRYAHELDLPGLRHWPLGRFPHLVFYIHLKDHVDVWRVLHGARDIPEWLHDEGA